MLHSEWLRFTDGDKSYRIYTSRMGKAKAPLPVVMVIQELWGTDSHILDVADRFAKAGYLAVAPDLYAENGQRLEILKENRIEEVKTFLDTLPSSSWHDSEKRELALKQLSLSKQEEIEATFQELFGRLKRLPESLEVLEATFRFLQNSELSHGRKVASIGYCMGGALSAMLACAEPCLSGAVVYYGNLPNEEQLQGIQCPVMGFFGRLDDRITNQVSGFAEGMQKAGKSFTYKIYEGALHAFFNDTRAAYHTDASRDSWSTILGFFNEILD